jgi:hypothetical protein
VDQIVEEIRAACTGLSVEEIQAQIEASQNAASVADPEALAQWCYTLANGS